MSNDVMVVMQTSGAGWHKMSSEGLAAGNLLAAQTGGACSAVVLGKDVKARAESLLGVSVLVVEHELLAEYSADGWVAALEQVIAQQQPGYVVFPHTYQVRDYAAKLATRMGQVLIGDVTAIHDGPTFVRQWMQGKLNAEYKHAGDGVCFVSVQAGSFAAQEMVGEQSTVTSVPVTGLDGGVIRTKAGEPFREAAQTVDLSAAQMIVSVGRGIGEQENLKLVEELASALGAELAASRPICDAGWLPMERQVGSSGQTVAPKVYLAVGISGAIQHLVGMKGAKTVIAINKDADAPIFEVADVGVVGDLFEVVPALTKALQNRA
jgi:electron transfer flavoprotein alpha subunit